MDQERDLDMQAIKLVQVIARHGSFAKAARALGLVPSALSYRVRQLEESLDVLLFDRRSRQALLTAAGAELLEQGTALIEQSRAAVRKVRQVAAGWEQTLTIASDSLINMDALLELVERFLALDAPTQVVLRSEVLSGTSKALIQGAVDLALGTSFDLSTHSGLSAQRLGSVPFVYAVAPAHPLAQAPEPLSDDQICHHRAVAVADTARDGKGATVGLLKGQSVLTVASMQAKLEAQMRGMGVGFLPEPLAREALQSGRLVARRVKRPERIAHLSFAWRHDPKPGKALSWWLKTLDNAGIRARLIGQARSLERWTGPV